jgi:hypothetical protein
MKLRGGFAPSRYALPCGRRDKVYGIRKKLYDDSGWKKIRRNKK